MESLIDCCRYLKEAELGGMSRFCPDDFVRFLTVGMMAHRSQRAPPSALL
jgi:hypothetical protein